MRVLILVAVLFAAVSGAVRAQVAGVYDDCNEAWLAQSWPAVAVKCASAEEAETETAIQHSAELDAGEAVDVPLERDMASTEWLLAATYGARSAYGYARLHRPENAKGAAKMALGDLQNAGKFADQAPTKDRILKMETFLQNPKFLSLPIAKLSVLD